MGQGALGIGAYSFGAASPDAIDNSGNLAVTGVRDAFGISGYTEDRNSPIAIVNGGDITAAAVDRFAIGILADNNGANGGTVPSAS